MNLRCLAVARAALGEPLRRTGVEIFFRCPNPKHDDQHPSLQMNEKKNVWMCGPCGMSGNAWQLAAFIGGLDPDDKAGVIAWLRDHELSSNRTNPGLTLSAYATAKRLPETFLRGLGLQDTRWRRKPAVLIPYQDAGGKLAASRFRLSLNGDSAERFRWQKGSKPLPYGLASLPEARKQGYVTLVEGESDAQTLWLHSIPALGIPGASNWQNGWAELLWDVPAIYAVIEPDRGGETLQNRLLASPISARLRLITLNGAKDPSELYVHNPAEFRQAWAAAMESAKAAPKVDGASVLREVVEFVRRFVSLTEAQANIVALWVLHTHTFEVADTTPYLSVTSPEKQSGKTRLLEVLDLLVANPWFTSRVTAAVLVRKVAAEGPTLLLDESDAAFKGAEEYTEGLRGILNSGHRRGGKVSLCVGQGQNIKYEDFSTFSPKVIAGIGNLPDTVADRSIPIRLKRRSPNEKVERFRDRTAPAAARPIRNRLVAWAGANMEALREVVPPVLPEVLSDRQQDGAEPLVTIADLIGGEWPFRARSCLVEVLHFDGASTESIGTRLLADIKTVFDSRASDRIFSKDLCQGLVEIETSPWAEWSHGKPLSLGKLARLLAPYGIVPGTVRIGTATAKGYVRDDFADAWGRYLQKDPESPFTPHSDFQNVTTPQPAPDAASVHFQSGTQEDDVTDQNEPKPAPEGSCDVVTFSKQNMAAERLIRGEI